MNIDKKMILGALGKRHCYQIRALAHIGLKRRHSQLVSIFSLHKPSLSLRVLTAATDPPAEPNTATVVGLP